MKSVLVTVKNIPELMAKEAGKLGELAQGYLPTAVESLVYSKLAEQLSEKLREQGVVAEVSVVEPKGLRPVEEESWSPGTLVAGGVLATALGAALLGMSKKR